MRRIRKIKQRLAALESCFPAHGLWPLVTCSFIWCLCECLGVLRERMTFLDMHEKLARADMG